MSPTPLTAPHRLSADEVLKYLDSQVTGLSHEEARGRLRVYGDNRLHASVRLPLLRSFLKQFTHFLAILLWIAAGLSFLTEFLQPGEGVSAIGWVIVGVIVVNAVFAFVQEFKADRAMQALQELLPATAWVMRDGQACKVTRIELVPGDIVLLEQGQQVPADARLLEASGMRVDNASLTGESAPQRRTADPSLDGQTLESSNLVFAGTTIMSGHGQGVVYATGMQTEFGKIAHLSATTSKGLSPLQHEIAALSRVVGIVSFAIGALFFAVSLSMGLGLWVSAIFGIGLIAANVPEGLLPTVTFALAMASQHMAKRRALIKQLTSVETLGCTTTICTDKTGTLTENRMRVDHVYLDETEFESKEGRLLGVNGVPCANETSHWKEFFDVLAHCHNVTRTRRSDGRFVCNGNPTEVALVEFVEEHAMLPETPLLRMGELPFDTDRKRMTTLHWRQGQLVAFVKGAPESIIALCDQQCHHGRMVAMTSTERLRLLDQSRRFAQQAYRVLAVATRTISQETPTLDSDTIERNLTFLGLVAIIDPPRREVPEAVTRCRQAGIRVIMITGDHPLTAVAIAQKVGLSYLAHDQTGSLTALVIEGSHLDTLTDDQVRGLLSRSGRENPIFSRVAPRQKMRVVSLLKEMGEIVAVTGDGVNDAPALKHADIGIAMGIAGTDVARETADMILLDDNFATIVNAIEEGRAVFANIRKFVTFVFSSNVAEMIPYLAYGLFRTPLALTVPQLLAIDLGTNMVPAVALGSELPHPGIMEIPPRPRSERLMDRPLFIRVFGFLGLLEGLIALGAFFWFLETQGWSWGEQLDWGSPLYREATTVTFAAIVLAQVANAFASRSDHVSIFRLGFTTNRLTLLGVAISIALLGSIIYTPIGNWMFGTSPLPLWTWLALVLGAISFLLSEETRKMIATRFLQR
jgi:sodium/potassium-transporting ATPase subunit alpha